MNLTITLQKAVLYCAAGEFFWLAVREAIRMARRIRFARRLAQIEASPCNCHCHEER